jgi:outer membrane protein assembly factor BamB
MAALCAISVQASAQPLKGDWPMLNFDAKGQRNNPYETVLTKKSVSSLQQAWKRDINSKPYIEGGSPAVAGGVLYLSSSDGTFYALDAVTGKKRWTIKLDNLGARTLASPAFANGIVYIPDSYALHALDAATGSTLWRAKFEEGTWGSPVVSHGLVFQDTAGAKLNALDARSGKKLWTTDIDGGSDSGGTPAVADGVVYTYSAIGLKAHTASTGALLWHTDSGGGSTEYTSPALANGRVLLLTDRGLTAYDAATGAYEWSQWTLSGYYGSLAVARDHAYTLDPAGAIWNYDANIGVPTLMQGQIGQTGSPTIANGILYVTAAPANNYDVSAYDVRTGALLWSAPLEAQAQTSPVVSNGMVYVVAGSLYAFALKK